MSQQGYTLGRDVALDIMTPDGPLRFGKITKFNSSPKMTSQEITALNGQTDELLIPKGWTGSIELERTGSEADDYWARWEDGYYNGDSQPTSTITETISEPNGTVSVYRYMNVVLHLSNAGDKEGDKTVKQSFTFTARRRKRA